MAPVAHNLTAGSTGTLSREEASGAVWDDHKRLPGGSGIDIKV